MSNDEWTTPRRCFDYLDSIFKFNMDAAATKGNALCPNYWTKEDDALTKDWSSHIVFCNPPFTQAKEFYSHALRCGGFFCMILPVRSDRNWFQDILHKDNIRRCWITGRLHFGGAKKGAFMYNIIAYRFPGAALPLRLDASILNDDGLGGARS